jgi:hypothetical protein
LIESDGKVGFDNFAGLNREERADYGRLMVATTLRPGEWSRLNEIYTSCGTSISTNRIHRSAAASAAEAGDE